MENMETATEEQATVEIGPITDPMGWINKVRSYPRLQDVRITLSPRGGYISLSGWIEVIPADGTTGNRFQVAGFTTPQSSLVFQGDLLDLEDAVGWAWGGLLPPEEE